MARERVLTAAVSDHHRSVMAGLDPAIHAFPPRAERAADVRIKSGHDELMLGAALSAQR
jgi:hypothetical protein